MSEPFVVEKATTVLKAILVVSAPLCFVISMSYFLGSKECHAKWNDFNPNYSFFGGCLIIIDGKRVPESAYINVHGDKQ